MKVHPTLDFCSRDHAAPEGKVQCSQGTALCPGVLTEVTLQYCLLPANAGKNKLVQSVWSSYGFELEHQDEFMVSLTWIRWVSMEIFTRVCIHIHMGYDVHTYLIALSAKRA